MVAMLTVTMNPSLDTAAAADRVQPDRKIRCTDVRHDPGGGGINVARAVHELGGDVTALWTKGGVFGTRLGHLLDTEGVEHRPVEIDGDTRQSFAVIEQSRSQHYRFSTPGPSLDDDTLHHVIAEVRRLRPSLLVMSGGLPPGVPTDFYARLGSVAVEMGTRVAVDTHGEPLRAALDGGDVLVAKPNYRELLDVAGLGAEPEGEGPDVAEVAQELIAKTGTTALLVSLGAAGAVLVEADRAERIVAPTVTIRSRIGAGDSMVAGLAWRLLQGDDLAEAARYGVAAGTAAVMTQGTELFRREDVERIRAGM